MRFNFEAGLPDPSTFPVDDLLRLSEQVVREGDGESLQYGSAYAGGIIYGYEGLRDRLAERILRRDGRAIDLSGIIVTSGGAQAISLACAAFLRPGDVAAVEAPTWAYAIRDIRLHGAEPIAIPLDEHGMRLDVLEHQLEQLDREGRRLKLLYTISTFNTPTGISMSRERRIDLVSLARKWGFVVIEDSNYEELRYEGEALPSLLSLDDGGLVLKVESFSKTVAPGLRLGWAAGHPDVVAALASVRRDLGVSQWLSHMMAAYLSEGLLDPHIATVNDLYRTKRDIAVAAIGDHCGRRVDLRVPEGGFFLWLGLDPGLDAVRLAEFMRAEGVACRPDESFFGDDSRRSHLRLAFSPVPAAELQRGIELLGRAIEQSPVAR